MTVPPSPRDRSTGPRALSLTMVASAITIATGFVTGPLQARVLGATGRGEVAAVIAPVSLVTLISGVGAGAYAVRDLARTGRPGQAIHAAIVVSGVASILLALTAQPMSAALSGGDAHRQSLIELGVLIAAATLVPSTVLNVLAAGQGRWGLLALDQILSALTFLAAITVMAIFGWLTATAVVVATLVGGPLSTLLLLPALNGLERPSREALRLVPSTVKFGLATHITTLGMSINMSVDQAVLAHENMVKELGYYVIAVTIAYMPTALLRGMTSFFFVRSAAGEATDAPRRIRLVSALSIILGLLTSLTALPLIVILFGPAFLPSVWLVLILTPGTVLMITTQALGSTMAGIGRARTPALTELTAAGITVIMLLLLVPVIGAYGAALTTAVANALNLSLLAVASARALKISTREMIVPTSADYSFIRDQVIAEVGRRIRRFRH